MNSRSLLIVAGIAVVLVVLAVMTQPSQDTTAARSALLLPELPDALVDIEEVRLETAGAETVATLTRSDAGWSVVERDGYPADIAKLSEVLLALSEARSIEAKTANPDYYDRLGVEPIEAETATGIAVSMSRNGMSLPTVILGDSVGTSYRYARLADTAQSLLIDRDPELPRDTGQWLVTDIVDVRGARMQQVTITHADGETVVISKPNAEQSNFDVANVPEDRELQYPGVANVIGNALRELKLEDVRRSGEPTDPSVTTEFRTFDGLIVTLRGYADGERAWLSFQASFDAQQAVDFGTEVVDESLPDVDTGLDPRAEAEQINARVTGWEYRIPSYQYDQMTRRLEDLLKARS